MKRFLIVQLFAAVVLLASCGKAERVSDRTDDGKSSQAAAATKISDYNKIIPLVTSAGFSSSEKGALSESASCVNIKEKCVGLADVQLEYAWEHGQMHNSMDIKVLDVPFRLMDDGTVSMQAQALSGSVTFDDGVAWTVETAFSIEAALSKDMEGSSLSLSSEEIYLDIAGFSPQAVEKQCSWPYIDYELYDTDRFINSTDKDVTINLGNYTVDADKEDYGLSPFTLAPGQAKEIRYYNWRFPDEKYYYGVPEEITVEYDGIVYPVKLDALAPVEPVQVGDNMIYVRNREKEYDGRHSFVDGFLSLFGYTTYIYRITPEALGL